jgi:hypothetical protein
MDETVLRRVRQAIGMTGSSNVEEARSMAIAACHMILKYNLVISLPAKPGEVAPSITPNDFDFPFSPTVQRTAPTPPRRGQTEAPPQSPPAPRSRKKKRKEPEDPPRKLKSKYPGRCKACGKTYDSGDTIYWKRDQGVTHYECGSEALEEVGS